MSIEYQFYVDNNLMTPIWGDDFTKEYRREEGQMFFREFLNGTLTFIRNDFEYIFGKNLDDRFTFEIKHSPDGGLNWTSYFKGYFHQTDCEFNLDSGTVKVTPLPDDVYVEVLSSLDKEFDLMQLPIKKSELTLWKRPLIQIYVPGDTKVSCFLGGMSWDQDVVQPVSNVLDLQNLYHFVQIKTLISVSVSGGGRVNGEDINLIGDYYPVSVGVNIGPDSIYTFKATISGSDEFFELIRNSDNEVMFEGDRDNPADPILLDAIHADAEGQLLISETKSISFYGRYLLDVSTISGAPTYDIPNDDLVPNNRNYRKCIGYSGDVIIFSNRMSATPTRFGKNLNGYYYVPPYILGGGKMYPLNQERWEDSSFWFNFSVFDFIFEEAGRKEYVLKNTLNYAGIISVLLGEIDPALEFDEETDYSEFLFSDINPVSGNFFTLLATQKSNLISGPYDQPAQKTLTTLAKILNGLKNTLQLYWFIEGTKFRIEHISWFLNGGRYLGSPGLSYDLTELEEHRNSKSWAYGLNSYSFDKEQMVERIQFEWMDEVSEGFKGYPIEIQSKYVERGNQEEISVVDVTTDVDYVLLNPENISRDGLILFSAVENNSRLELPFITRMVDGAELKLQNGLLSFIYLHPTFWVWDLPSSSVLINKEIAYILSVKLTKLQEVRFPSLTDPDLFKLIRTNLGDGKIRQMRINLSSRIVNATLEYEP